MGKKITTISGKDIDGCISALEEAMSKGNYYICTYQYLDDYSYDVPLRGYHCERTYNTYRETDCKTER